MPFFSRQAAWPRLRSGLLAWAVTGLVALPVLAEKADRNKPMNAEADSLRYDDARQTSVFTGNVIITKGSMVIRGERVEVRQDAEGYQFGTATGSAAKRAFFRQKRDVPAGAAEEWIEGEAESLAYDGKSDTITFNKSAVLRRLRGAQVVDETSGNVISYDNTSEVFNVVGGAASASPGNPSGRVRAVLSPRGSAAPGTPTPSSPSANTPSTSLRPSTTLGGDKK
jgi:lipopolysaccharide export system protein LptA